MATGFVQFIFSDFLVCIDLQAHLPPRLRQITARIMTKLLIICIRQCHDLAQQVYSQFTAGNLMIIGIYIVGPENIALL